MVGKVTTSCTEGNGELRAMIGVRRSAVGLVLALLALSVAPTAAHNVPDCPQHGHFVDFNGKKLPGNRCDQLGTPCAVAAASTCRTVETGMLSYERDCQCKANGGGGCTAVGSELLITAGVPGPFDTRLYSTQPSEESESAVIAGDALFQLFDPESIGLEGTVLLTYGEFTDPENVPVTIDEVILSFPALSLGGLDTGEHFVSLSSVGPQTMNYDSTTGILTPSGDSILVDIANDLGKHTQVPVYLQAEIDLDPQGDGPARLYGQLTTDLPDGFEGLMFLNGFETGDTAFWSAALPLPSLGVASLLLVGGLGAIRRRRSAEGQVEPGAEPRA